MSNEVQNSVHIEGEHTFNPHDFYSKFSSNQRLALELYDVFSMHTERRGYLYHATLRATDSLERLKAIGVPVLEDPFTTPSFERYMNVFSLEPTNDKEQEDRNREFTIGCGYSLILASLYEIRPRSNYGGPPYQFHKRPDIDEEKIRRGVSALKIATAGKVLEDDRIMGLLNTLPSEVLEIINTSLSPSESQPVIVTQPQ